jgi:CRP/FNR family transcriptional regulator, cyclic AMP receptor protein
MTHMFATRRIRDGASRASRANGWRPRRQRMERPQIAEPRCTLSDVALFTGLLPEALERIQRRCRWRHYEPGEPIVDYLDVTDDVFFLTAGEARVTIYSVDGKVVSFRELGPGAMFGEYAAIDGGPRSAGVEARGSCQVASMPSAEFRNVLQTERKVAQALLEHFVRELRELTTRVFEFSTLAVRYRIQAEVLRLASLAPRQGKSARIVPAPTHAEIASRVSTHREAVTRELNRLSQMGVIERRSGTLIVGDFDRLAQMVHDAIGEND